MSRLSAYLRARHSQRPFELGLGPHGRFRFYLHGDELISNYMREHGVWEQVETDLLLRLLKPGDVFYDIGANIGWYSVVLGRHVGSRGAVYSFEPDQRNFALLIQNCRLNRVSGARLFNIAVSNVDGRGNLYRHPTNFGDHRLGGGTDRVEVESIPTKTLGSVVEQEGLRRPDLLKIDTQGSEAKILEALPFLFKKNPEMIVVFEFWPFGLKSTGSSAAGLIDLLRPHDLNLYLVSKDRTVPLAPTTIGALEANAANEHDHDFFSNVLAIPPSNTGALAAISLLR